MEIIVKIKCFIFDIDEVIIRQKAFYSEYLELQGYNNASTVISNYYYGGYDDECVYGLKNPLIEIKPFLDIIKWEYSAFEYFKNDFEYQKQYVDYELLENIKKLKTYGFKCFLATDQDQVRMKYILENFEFNKVFDFWFVSSNMKARKKNKEFWEMVEIELVKQGINIAETLFIDDRIENINLASKQGINTFHIKNYESIHELKMYLAKYIEK